MSLNQNACFYFCSLVLQSVQRYKNTHCMWQGILMLLKMGFEARDWELPLGVGFLQN